MIIYDLRCGGGHVFEGWFAGREEYERESRAGRLECPVCGGRTVDLVPSGGHVGRSRPLQEPTQSPTPRVASGRMTFFAAVAEALEKNFENVGERFREEALKMHWGETEQRNIRGSMTREEEKDLVEEGVEFSRIALPRFQG